MKTNTGNTESHLMINGNHQDKLIIYKQDYRIRIDKKVLMKLFYNNIFNALLNSYGFHFRLAFNHYKQL